eukprot:gnl/Carplike_NY0171/4312_a5846_358.p1 GENE.gnl/Carplike_NY0171/4312_a5846_358~~gnl/Carplike_NY0171/4312_a5846_358.p1  ORF type:complete len:166 (-),score=42.42 gnl/Carplike_NY0171/4312_a5846_358:47-505(-)
MAKAVKPEFDAVIGKFDPELSGMIEIDKIPYLLSVFGFSLSKAEVHELCIPFDPATSGSVPNDAALLILAGQMIKVKKPDEMAEAFKVVLAFDTQEEETPLYAPRDSVIKTIMQPPDPTLLPQPKKKKKKTKSTTGLVFLLSHPLFDWNKYH